MTMIEFLEALHEAAAGATDLQSLEAGFLRLSRSTGEHHVPGCGICQQLKLWAYHAEVSMKQVNAAFTDIAARWPEHSGDGYYPVPSPDARMRAEDYYLQASRVQMWLPGEPYADARLRLLRFVIDELKSASI